MQTLTLEIDNKAAYKALLEIATHIKGVRVCDSGAVAEESTVNYTRKKINLPKTVNNLKPKKEKSLADFAGSISLGMSIEQVEDELSKMRSEWERNF